MYYLLGYKLYKGNKEDGVDDATITKMIDNTYILALDGDVDFNAEALLLLVDLMKKSGSIGAACGRIHPIGAGSFVYLPWSNAYFTYIYAIAASMTFS